MMGNLPTHYFALQAATEKKELSKTLEKLPLFVLGQTKITFTFSM